jgi:hypothetical protein
MHLQLQRPASQRSDSRRRVREQVRRPHRRLHEETSSARRPLIEAAGVRRQPAFDIGYELQPAWPVMHLARLRSRTAGGLLPVVLNSFAAFVALGAALAAGRRRRRRGDFAAAPVMRLPVERLEPQLERHAA